ncbi:ABC transporter ATP-binding protein [Desertivirga arenae]|uniref:ABC transporter ATP-binding protein n=1 Tax=Desertivirga arenae TaxID=2810309 RepID=UPI001A9770A0|nr:ATP-binding cassette domain-containing protein [Pedobacter sp. SYSU D00823]
MQRNFAIETENLCYSFKGQKIIDNISLKVPENSIYGFLGPNGAGKTTTIKQIMGLLPGSGIVKFFGETIPYNKIEVHSRIGSLIETPSLYEHLSAEDNLNISVKLRRLNRSRVQEVLQLVKLTHVHSYKKVKHFSLGMKQRLGIALALLPNPKLLILDEPVNGLDPEGIIDMRELLISLNREVGTTIFISSHLLAELEKMVSHVGIINQGKLVYQDELKNLRHVGEVQSKLTLQTSNNAHAELILAELNQNYTVDENVITVHTIEKKQLGAISRAIIAADIDIYHLMFKEKDLEENFMYLINR